MTNLLRVRDVATMLCVAESTVYGMCAAGKLAHIRLGCGRGTIRIPQDAIKKLTQSCPDIPFVKPYVPKVIKI